MASNSHLRKTYANEKKQSKSVTTVLLVCCYLYHKMNYAT
jgi:hypothetical protein